MKFGIGIILLLGALVGGSLIVYGITSREKGFLMWVGMVVLGLVLLWYYMRKLRQNPPSKRPLTGMENDQ